MIKETTDRIPIPKGGFRTNEDEARWLEQTICLRARQMMLAAGVNATIRPNGLYDLLLMSLNAASERAEELVTLPTDHETPSPQLRRVFEIPLGATHGAFVSNGSFVEVSFFVGEPPNEMDDRNGK